MRGPSLKNGKQFVGAVAPGRAEALRADPVSKANADRVKVIYSDSGDETPEELLAAMEAAGFQAETLDAFRRSAAVAKSRERLAEKLIAEHDEEDCIVGDWQRLGRCVLFAKAVAPAPKPKPGANLDLSDEGPFTAEQVAAILEAKTSELRRELAAMTTAYSDIQKVKAEGINGSIVERLMRVIEDQAGRPVVVNINEQPLEPYEPEADGE